jgi:hypothetical protein
MLSDMTIRTLSSLALAVGVSTTSALAADKAPDGRLYELRTYHAAPGKLDALLTRFREHTVELFNKHGMTNVGYWLPVDNKDNVLVYLLAYPDKAAREADWKAFSDDPEWQKTRSESEKDGTLVTGVDQVFMTSTDFSPGFTPLSGDKTEHLFEMRTYTTTPGHLPNLHKRFRDHTLGFFNTHHMTSLGYYQPVEGQPGHDDKLIYFLAHSPEEGAAAASWKAFQADPGWIAAKKASEDEAGGSLTVVPDGVKSVFLKATDFSPVK